MAYWLVKSEPSKWSWDDQVGTGARGAPWDGVRNHLAKKYLQAMRKSDRAFFYHSNEDRAIVGVVEIIAPFQEDPADPPFGWVDVRARQPFAHPVTLSQIKADPRLADMALVRNARLSVQPVTDEEWAIVSAMGARG